MKTIQSVLAELHSRYEMEVGERTARVERITQLLAQYESAVQEDAVTAIERLTGMAGGSTESVAVLVAEALLREVQELPELAPTIAAPPKAPAAVIVPTPSPSAVSVPPAPPERFPAVEARVHGGDQGKRRLVIFGGDARAEKCRWMEKVLDVPPESVTWIPAPSAAAPGGILTGAREGRLAGVIVLTELCAHGQFNAITDACQAGGVPHSNGGRGGQGQLLEALRTMERWLGKQVAA